MCLLSGELSWHGDSSWQNKPPLTFTAIVRGIIGCEFRTAAKTQATRRARCYLECRDSEVTARLLAGTNLTIQDITMRVSLASRVVDVNAMPEQVMKKICDLAAGVEV